MKLSTFEKYMIASPILVNLILPYAMGQLDLFLDAYTKYFLLALIIMTFYPIFAGAVLKSKAGLGLYLVVHIITALISIYVIYNDSALIYLYLSLILLAITLAISMIVRKIRHQ